MASYYAYRRNKVMMQKLDAEKEKYKEETFLLRAKMEQEMDATKKWIKQVSLHTGYALLDEVSKNNLGKPRKSKSDGGEKDRRKSLSVLSSSRPNTHNGQRRYRGVSVFEPAEKSPKYVARLRIERSKTDLQGIVSVPPIHTMRQFPKWAHAGGEQGQPNRGTVTLQLPIKIQEINNPIQLTGQQRQACAQGIGLGGSKNAPKIRCINCTNSSGHKKKREIVLSVSPEGLPKEKLPEVIMQNDVVESRPQTVPNNIGGVEVITSPREDPIDVCSRVNKNDESSALSTTPENKDLGEARDNGINSSSPVNIPPLPTKTRIKIKVVPKQGRDREFKPVDDSEKQKKGVDDLDGNYSADKVPEEKKEMPSQDVLDGKLPLLLPSENNVDKTENKTVKMDIKEVVDMLQNSSRTNDKEATSKMYSLFFDAWSNIRKNDPQKIIGGPVPKPKFMLQKHFKRAVNMSIVTQRFAKGNKDVGEKGKDAEKKGNEEELKKSLQIMKYVRDVEAGKTVDPRPAGEREPLVLSKARIRRAMQQMTNSPPERIKPPPVRKTITEDLESKIKLFLERSSTF